MLWKPFELWAQLRAVEMLVQGIGEEFGGEEAALPDVRHLIDRTGPDSRRARRHEGRQRPVS